MTEDTGFSGNACNNMSVNESKDLVAIPAALFQDTKAAGFLCGASTMCGSYIYVISNIDGQPYKAQVVEKAGPGVVVPYGLDLSSSLFNKVINGGVAVGVQKARWYIGS